MHGLHRPRHRHHRPRRPDRAGHPHLALGPHPGPTSAPACASARAAPSARTAASATTSSSATTARSSTTSASTTPSRWRMTSSAAPAWSSRTSSTRGQPSNVFPAPRGALRRLARRLGRAADHAAQGRKAAVSSHLLADPADGRVSASAWPQRTVCTTQCA